MELTEQKLSNLEDDLTNSEWICEKVKDDVYAQNLYAALCNNEFVKNEVLPILREEFWSCSWRYAGDVIANLRGEGDYMNWYCSGLTGDWDSTIPSKHYVGEGTVTDEIRGDLRTLGWIVLDDKYD